MQLNRLTRHIFAIEAMARAVSIAALVEDIQFVSSVIPRRERNYRRPLTAKRGRAYKPNGEQECAKAPRAHRRWQVDRG